MNYDILTVSEEALTSTAEAGFISARKNSTIDRYGVRRFENGKIYQTSRLGSAATERLIADTQERGGPGMPHDFGFAPSHQESRFEAAQDEKVLSLYEEGLLRLRTSYPDFVFGGKCSVQNISLSLKSSYGLDLKTSSGFCEWYYLYQRKGSGNMVDGYFGEGTSRPDINHAISEHEEFLQNQGKIVDLKSGRLPVLFADTFQPIAKLVESFSVNKYEEGAAIYRGQLGNTLFSEKVSIVDSAYDVVNGNFQFFDGEGVVRTKDLPLIERGQFTNLISDLRFGKKFNRASTGNGLRVYNRGVTLGPRSLRLLGGKKSWREITKDLDRCIIAMVAVGGDSNDLGEFSTPVQVGYVMEKGQIIGQAPQITIKTSVSDYLGKNLIDVASDGFTKSTPSACVISEMQVLVN